MKVNINGIQKDFLFDFDESKMSENGWLRQNVDFHKFEIIGGTKVFVKCFTNGRHNINGFDFLMRVKNQNIDYLPTVYDFVRVPIGNKDIFLLFLEVLDGKTLEEVIKEEGEVKPVILAQNIYLALQNLFSYGFWYSDFVEKNIFVTANHKYYLIDLDSVAPINIMAHDHDALGNVSQSYIIAVSNYWYKKIFNFDFQYVKKHMRGDVMNQLQLIHLIAQLHLFDCNGNIDLLDTSARKLTPAHVISINYKLTNAIFISSFNIQGGQQLINYQLFTYFVKNMFFENYEHTIKIRTEKSVGKKTPDTIKIKNLNDKFEKTVNEIIFDICLAKESLDLHLIYLKKVAKDSGLNVNEVIKNLIDFVDVFNRATDDKIITKLERMTLSNYAKTALISTQTLEELLKSFKQE